MYIIICKKFMCSCIMYFMNICGCSIISHAFDYYTVLYPPYAFAYIRNFYLMY